MQVAAKEARKGHGKLAQDIKKLVEKSQTTAKPNIVSSKTVPFTQKNQGELNGLLQLTPAQVRNGELVFSDTVQEHLNQVLLEQRQKDKLRQFGLQSRRKLLFTGSPGTGKTMSASMLATELKLPLYTIVLDNLITRFMGETAAKLRLIFEHISQTRAVYLFDEFDAIGTQRGSSNDVGEIRRVLNSFLLFVEQDTSESIILAATNHPELLDQALYRRFDDIIKFEKPKPEQIHLLIKNRLSLFDTDDFDIALVFIPEDKRSVFLKKIEDYLNPQKDAKPNQDNIRHPRVLSEIEAINVYFSLACVYIRYIKKYSYILRGRYVTS